MRGLFVSKLAAALCVVAAVLALIPGNADAAKDGYSVVLLANPDEVPYIYANDINDAGRICGGMEFQVDGTWYQAAVLWKKWNADPVVLDPIGDDVNAVAFAMNDKGQVCGRSMDWPNTRRAVIWDHLGEPKDMHPDLGGTYSEMWDINQYGDGVGNTFVPNYARAFVSPNNGDPYLLPLDTDVYVQSWGLEINKDCTVAGFARFDLGTGWGPVHACFWTSDGTFEDLHDDIEADLDMEIVASKAWGVMDSGEIGGLAVISMAGSTVLEAKAFVWTEKDGFDWIDSGGSDLSVIGGSGGKRFVGIVDGVLEYPQWYSASIAVWTRGTEKGETVWNLDVLPIPDGYTGMSAYRVNTSGRVVGVVADGDYAWAAFYATK